MKFGLAFILGILIFSAGLHGDLGSILACFIDPGALGESTPTGTNTTGADTGINTGNITPGTPTAPRLPGLPVQTGLIGVGSGIMGINTGNITGGPTAPRIPGLPVQTGFHPCLFGFILC